MGKEQKHCDTEQRQFWQMVIETWQSSGLSIRQFCKQEGLSEPAFYSWRKKLTKGNKLETDKQKELNSPAFIEVSMPKDNPVALELVLSSGNTLRIGSAADNKTLGNVLSALHREGLC
jgi:transposase-like protein